MTRTLFFLQLGLLFVACTKDDNSGSTNGAFKGTVLSPVDGCNQKPFNVVYSSIQSQDGKMDTLMTTSLPSELAKVGSTFTFNISQNNESTTACVQDKIYFPYKNLTDIEPSR